MDEAVKRINFLYKKSKEEGLTDKEKAEQKKLRDAYIAKARESLKGQLDGVKLNNKKKKN